MNSEFSILVAPENDPTKLKSVTGVNEKGEAQTENVSSTIDPSKFLTVDRNMNPIGNFFANFWEKLKNPHPFFYFKLNDDDLKKIKEITPEELAKQDVTGEVKRKIKENDLSDTYMKKENVNWEALKEFGVTEDNLKKDGSLKSLLNGYGSNNLVNVNFEAGGIKFNGRAKIFFSADDNQNITISMKGKHDYPNFNSYDIEFTPKDKENLLKTGNLGRLAMHTFKGEDRPEPTYISLDHLTNRIVPFRVSAFKMRDTYKGASISEEQKKSLYAGKAIYLKGMKSVEGKNFNGYVQINAETRGLALIINQEQKKTQSQDVKEDDPTLANIRKEIGGQKLSPEQRYILKDAGTIFVPQIQCKDETIRDAYFKVIDGQIKYFDAGNEQNKGLALEVINSIRDYAKKNANIEVNTAQERKQEEKKEGKKAENKKVANKKIS